MQRDMVVGGIWLTTDEERAGAGREVECYFLKACRAVGKGERKVLDLDGGFGRHFVIIFISRHERTIKVSRCYCTL